MIFMKLLRLCSYFSPEKVASSHLYDDVYSSYAEAKIHCTCITPSPSRGISNEVRKQYKKIKTESLYDGYITVKRFSMMKEGRNPLLRAMRYGFCSIIQYFKGIREKNIDAVFSSSTPPIQGMLSAMVAKKLSKKYKRHVPFIYNLQDIFPDSLVTAKMTKEGSFIWKIGRKIENYTYKSADKIIVISEGFKKNIMAKGVEESKIEIISNWIDTDSVHPVLKEENKLFDEFNLSRDKFTVVYAGNFGEVQGAEIILDAAEKLKENENIQFAIFGGGALFENAKIRAEKMDNVFIHELLPLDRVSEVYSLGNVALITCKKGTGSSAMPSKTWSIMACNTPIIASFDTDSDLADVLRDSFGGKCVEPGDAHALSEAITQMSQETQTEVNLREYVKIHADKTTCLDKYIDILQNAGKETN